MTGNLKQLVSVRLNAADLAKIRDIAKNLDARDSEVFRFALRLAFMHLGPLHDPTINGSALISLFLEHGAELIRHFDLDADAINGIVNRDDVESAARVAREDIELLAMLGLPEQYLYAKLNAIGKLDMNETGGGYQALHNYLKQKYLPQSQLVNPVLGQVTVEASEAKFSAV